MEDLLYGGLCWTLIVVSVVCAVFRWGHLCHPYHLEADYYYPARRYVCAFYLLQLLALPFVVRPSEPHTLLYTRCVELVLTTTLLPLILNRFFRPKARLCFPRAFAFYLLPLAAFGLVGVVTLFRPDNLFLSAHSVFLWVVGAVAGVMCVVLLNFTVWLWRAISRYHRAEYSNEDDFPYRFAQKVLFSPWVVVAGCWAVFGMGSRPVMGVLWALLCVLSVYYGVTILHPQRKGVANAEGAETEIMEEVLAEEEPTEAEPALNEDVCRRVFAIVRRRYLEPHLMRRDIIAEFDYGERTMAGAVISHYGFYDMVNTLRLAHARRYAEAHPNETKESVAVSSGFKDRFAMRHAARRIGEGTAEVLDGFEPLGD